MIKIDKSKKQKIHTRRIDIATYEGDADAIVVEGILKDDRLLDTHQPTGEVCPPGTVHHMVIRMVLRGPQLIIEDIEVEMPTIPHDACIETRDCLAPVKGMSLVSGFTSKARKLIGGTKGCHHFLSLLTAMTPAAVQGAFGAMARKPMDADLGNAALEMVKNTCWVWREDGPLIKEYLAGM